MRGTFPTTEGPVRFASATLITLALCLAGPTPAIAAPSAEPLAAPRASLAVSTGLALRSLTLTSVGLETTIDGLSPVTARLATSWYARRWLGVTAEASGEWFAAVRQDELTGTSRIQSFSGSALAAAKLWWVPVSGFSIEGQLGYALAARPVIALVEADAPFRGRSATAHGLSVGASFGLQHGAVSATAHGHVVPWSFGAQIAGDASRALVLELGASVGLDVYEGQALGLAVILDYGFHLMRSRALQTSATFSGGGHLVGLGLRLWLPNADDFTRRRTHEPRRLRGTVTHGDGSPAASASVTANGLAVAVDASGSFTATFTAPQMEIAATLEGFRPAAVTVRADEAGGAPLALVLAPPNGPGRIRGTVRSVEKDLPVASAEVLLDGEVAGTTDEAGEFLLAKAGPGAVTVTVKARGYVSAEEAVSVPPEAEAKVVFALKSPGASRSATLRGLVRSATGRVIQAQVRIQGLDVKVAVRPDGRFLTEVPAGRWTLVISAPLHQTQSKAVEVAGGDQALFHCDLQPVGR